MTDWTLVQRSSDMGKEKLDIVETVARNSPTGVALEIGTRAGGSALLALSSNPGLHTILCVDPYGSKPFRDMDGAVHNTFTDDLYRMASAMLTKYALDNNRVYIPFKMTSSDFFRIYADLWLEGTPTPLRDLKFSYVLVDGDHSDETVQMELDNLEKRMMPGGIILVDNIDWLSLPFEGWEKPRHDMAYKQY